MPHGLFYPLMIIIGFYFSLCCACLLFPYVQMTVFSECVLSAFDRSLDNHRNYWLAAVVLATAYYVKLWMTTF